MFWSFFHTNNRVDWSALFFSKRDADRQAIAAALRPIKRNSTINRQPLTGKEKQQPATGKQQRL